MGLLSKFFHKEKEKSCHEEVIAHLTDLLNAKEGFGAFQKGFGLKDYSYSQSREAMIEEIKQDIAKNIKAFEKRIELIEIEEVPDPNALSLKFRIRCSFFGKKEALSVIFNNQKENVTVEVAS